MYVRGLSGLYAMQAVCAPKVQGGKELWKLGRSVDIARRAGEMGHVMRVGYVLPAEREALKDLERELLRACPFPIAGSNREWIRVNEIELWEWLIAWRPA